MSKNVVIVGGGPAGGSQVAKALISKFPSATITLVNPRPYALSRPTLPRMVVSDQNELFSTKSALIPYDKIFTPSNKNAKFVQGEVVEIKTKEKGGAVILADGKELPYDALVLAPGSFWEGPIDFPENPDAASSWIAETRAKFSKAQNIVLAGGGAVGVEIAGEIKDIWPNKEVTIVHGEGGIMNPTYSSSFRKRLEKGLHRRGINIILNDFIDEIPLPGPVTIKTRNGHAIDADLVIPTRGPRPRTDFVGKSLGASTLDERGQIKVKPTLQLLDHPEIFALGDAINYVEQKQVMKAMAHAPIVVANVIAYLSGQPVTKQYKGSTEMILVTNGKNGGGMYLGFLWGITFGDWLARLLKSGNLLVPMTRGAMGY